MAVIIWQMTNEWTNSYNFLGLLPWKLSKEVLRKTQAGLSQAQRVYMVQNS